MSKDMSGPPDTPDEEKDSTRAHARPGESPGRPDNPAPDVPEVTEVTGKAGSAEKSDATEIPETGPADSAGGETAEGTSERGVDRRVVAVAAALVLACAGLVGYGVLNTEDEPGERAVPTAEVTYEVRGEGTADITYLARSEAGKATVASDVTLPWKKTVEVPLGKEPTVSILLGEKGGEASCALAIRGRHVQRSTAFGSYGRATCSGALPAPEPAVRDSAVEGWSQP
ncbi:hypothetical protein SUDANB106_01704 [Streptomyces sp. enrichment culture]